MIMNYLNFYIFATGGWYIVIDMSVNPYGKLDAPVFYVQ